MKTVNIVGGGISGLTAGVYLLNSEFDVNIYEKNGVVGGFCTSWQRGSVIIDGCLHWLIGTRGGSSALMRNVSERFKALGGKLITGAPVSEIVIENGKAKGVRLESGELVYGDYTVAACDVHHTFEKLLKNKYSPNAFFDSAADKEKYSTYSYITAAFKTNMDLRTRNVSEIYKTEKFDLSGKECDVLSVRQYAYDESFTNDGYTVLQVFVDMNEDDYERIRAMSRSEYVEINSRLFYLFSFDISSTW